MSDILFDVTEGIATLTIDRVSKKNSITAEMYASMADALADADADPGVRVLLIQGDEAVFSAGNDLKEFLDPSLFGAEAPVGRFLSALPEFSKPFVAAVCGPAVGVGSTLLLHCDLVYAGENATFSFPFVNLGLCPEAGSSYLLAELIGYRRAAEALLLGGPIAAQEARQIGLVNEVLPIGEVAGFALDQARRLASQPLPALIETKRLLKNGRREALRAQMDQEMVSFGRLLREPAAKEAFSAFFEGRTPDFASVGA